MSCFFSKQDVSYYSKRTVERNQPSRAIIVLFLLVVLVIGLSIISNRIWGGKPEQPQKRQELRINSGMTILQFGQANNLPNAVLKEIFDLKVKSDLERKLLDYGSSDQITSLVARKLALAAEHASKNWIKIPVKFGLWIVFLGIVFILFGRRKVVSDLRNWLLLLSILIFGIAMGSDPGPMGTVKDAVHLYGTAHAIFPPRMIALGIFLAIVLIANKYICAWGCQAGTLQDLIFHINRTEKQTAVLGRQIKIPFVLTNSIRLVFFSIFSIIAFAWGIDIIDPIDPFKIYKPIHLGFIGGIFIGILLLGSLFIYRPWCHLFCPFGLVGWLVEKASRVKISVDYTTCIACQRCASACPSTVMGAILKRDKKTIPDCFVCYTCREVCPTNSIHFSTRNRTTPPAGFFEKKRINRATDD